MLIQFFLPPELLKPPTSRLALRCSFKVVHENGYIHISKCTDHSDSDDQDFDDIFRDIDEENEPYDSDVLRLRGGSVSLTPNASIPIGLVSNCNRYLHPQICMSLNRRAFELILSLASHSHWGIPPLIRATPLQ